jgi:predicted dehydrogenase
MKPSLSLTRRHFIQRGVAAAAATAVILPRAVLGADGHIPPSERLSVGVIGTGKFGLVPHLSTLLDAADVQVAAVCDVDTTRREYALKTVAAHDQNRSSKGCKAYNDFRKVLERKDIDAVLIATPDHWHAIQVIEACQAGKDIYCEKPLSLTIHEAETMIQAVRKHGRILQTGSQQRSGELGPFTLACALVRSGRLGKVQTVQVGVGGPSRWCDLPAEAAEPGLDWDMWLGPAPDRPYHSRLSQRGLPTKIWPQWRDYREYSGGAMTDTGAHFFDIAQWALDMDRSGPSQIIPPEDPKVFLGVKYVYPNGVEMIPGGDWGITFKGTNGELYVTRGKMTSKPKEIAATPLGAGDVHLPVSPGHLRDWLNAIRSRKPPISDVEIGARSVTVCHLGNLAYWHRRKLQWDAQKWRFIDDEEANQWLDYQRRAPWQLPKV